MASVWEGVHVTQNVPVAVKILTSTLYLRPEFARAFENEVHAIARMYHPGVVMVLDTGAIGNDVAAAADFAFPPGSPYLVMELASGGTLSGTAGSWRWKALRSVLMALLSALSHAHARRVIHRDIKPGNVLLSTRSDVRPGVKLTDFGIAEAGLREASNSVREAPFGTPFYMAPEQFEGAWRRYGPWTDLYGLGVLAWEMATGSRPFGLPARSRNPMLELARAHAFEEPGEFRPVQPVPRGFEAWLRRLLEKRPRERYQRAADAAWALSRLGEPDPTLATGAPSSEDEAPPTVSLEALKTVADDGVIPHVPLQETGPLRAYVDVPPLPRRWRRSRVQAPLKLVGAGLELWGLRSAPFVGRDPERGRIWEALRQVRQLNRGHAVIIRGRAGIGKSRLAEWMVQRADEVGNATVLKAVHSPLPGPAHGLRRMLSDFLGSAGLDGELAYAHLERQLADLDLHDLRLTRALTDFVVPEGESGDSADHSEAFAAMARLVRQLGLERPVVIWLDDVQWGVEALSWLRFVLRQQESLPTRVLFVCTVREEALVAESIADDLLREIAGGLSCTGIELGPLTGDETRSLVGDLLGLDTELRRTVAERSAGNPLFATQLVGDWVQRGVLEVTEGGFALAQGATAEVPDDIRSLWESPLARALEGLPPAATCALEIAAALGQDVEAGEWRTACLAGGVAISKELVPRLALRQLAVRRETGFSFVHGLLRETLQAEAIARGRWAAHNDACARMLLSGYREGSADLEERLATHLFAAHREEEALAHVLRLVKHAQNLGQYKRALGWLDRLDRAVEELGFDVSDARVVEAAVSRTDVLNASGRPQEAEQSGDIAVAAAPAHGALMDNLARRARGYSALAQGQFAVAQEHFQHSFEVAKAEGLLSPLANSLMALGNIARVQGQLDVAASYYERAIHRFDQAREAGGRANGQRLLGQVHRQRGDLENAERLYREAARWAKGEGFAVGEARALNGLAEVYRAKGQLMRAKIHYEAALPVLDEAVSGDAASIRLNLALTMIAMDDPAGARDLAERTLRDLERGGQKVYAGFARAVLLPVVAAAAELESVDLQIEAVEQTLVAAGVVDADVARCAMWAGQYLESVDADRARRAYEVALAQYTALSRDEDAEELQRRLARLDSAG